MCCKILHIAELAKPADTWCQHIARGGGCGIYDTRFPVCRGYKCQWLLDETFGPEWQPHRCKFIMHGVDGKVGLWVNVDRSSPMAWRKEPFYSRLKQWSAAARDGSGYVAVCTGGRTYILFPEEDLDVPGVPPNGDLKVGYRHVQGTKRPLVMVRAPDGSIAEHLGQPIARFR
jgi:hypothetical protein